MLGSLTFYRRILNEKVFSKGALFTSPPQSLQGPQTAAKHTANQLPTLGHAMAGVFAGFTVRYNNFFPQGVHMINLRIRSYSFIAAPVEHIKARLQIQYAADKSKRLYSGPIDCTRKIVRGPS